jgi:hypothetical protein
MHVMGSLSARRHAGSSGVRPNSASGLLFPDIHYTDRDGAGIFGPIALHHPLNRFCERMNERNLGRIGGNDATLFFVLVDDYLV